MKTDAVIKQEGLNALIERLGFVDAERFVVLIKKEPFDYTKWRQNHLDESMTIRDLSRQAEAYSAPIRS